MEVGFGLNFPEFSLYPAVELGEVWFTSASFYTRLLEQQQSVYVIRS